MRTLLTIVLLIVSVMPLMSEPPPILEPPEHLQTWAVLNGETGLFFGLEAWTEFSGLVYTMVQQTAIHAAAEAARPLLVENEGLKTERDIAMEQVRWAGVWKVVGIVGVSLAVVEGVILILK